MCKIWSKYKEVLLYLVFGLSTTAINWLIYMLFNGVFDVEMTISNGCAWGVAVLFAFLTNKWFVFESKCMTFGILFKEAMTFMGARIFSGLLEIFLPTFLFSIGIDQSLFGIQGFWAKLIVSFIVVFLNYILSKIWVFKK